MDSARIAELLQPFLVAPAASPAPNDLPFRAGFSPEESAVLSPTQVQSISAYIDLLLRWNARINLTSIREPEQIVTRHFGESLFAARALFPTTGRVVAGDSPAHLIDIGSGAGFPGLPIKIWAPDIRLTLIESNQKKATFLREVIRAIRFTNVDVLAGRAEDFPTPQPGEPRTVTLRAVERFEHILPVAATLVPPGGRLALLIGDSQVPGRSRISSRLHLVAASQDSALICSRPSDRTQLGQRDEPRFTPVPTELRVERDGENNLIMVPAQLNSYR